jgi:hypothetical protein
MRGAPRLTLIGIGIGLVLAGWILRAPAPAAPARPYAAPTIEPTLPLMLDLRLGPVTRADAGGSAVLQVEVATDRALRDLSLHLQLPRDVSAESGSFPDETTEDLAPEGRRLFSVPLRSARNGSFPIQVLATFSLPDGRTFRTLQGATLEVGVAARPGRSHAGAYEVMGVPIEELGR